MVTTLNYALIGANGDTIEFDYSNYVLNGDFAGFGIPPAEVRIDYSAGDGGVFKHAKRGVRDLDIPITVMGTDRADVQAKLRRLAKMTQNNFGPLILEARYSSGTRLRLETYYVGGAESQWGDSAGNTFCRWVLSLRAPQPYWQSTTTQQFTVTQGGIGRGLLPQLTKMKVTSSQAIGRVVVNNAGDVPAYPTYRIIGPISDFAVSYAGQSFGFNSDLTEGEIIYVNTETGEVYDAEGANRYDILNPAPKLFRIPVGSSSIVVNGVDLGDTTRIDVYYPLRYEVVH